MLRIIISPSLIYCHHYARAEGLTLMSTGTNQLLTATVPSSSAP